MNKKYNEGFDKGFLAGLTLGIVIGTMGLLAVLSFFRTVGFG